MTSTVGITGASGYVGSLLRRAFDQDGHRTVALVRAPGRDPGARPYALGDPVDPAVLADLDVLVHCAYDFTALSREEIWRVNVDGSRRLLAAARDAGVGRVVHISSMSAYDGTRQLYGRAKLAIEAATAAVGGVSVRPGLVYGDEPGGMAGLLVRLTALPLTPIVGGRAHQFLVHEDDLAVAVTALATAPSNPSIPVSVAHPEPVRFAELLRTFAERRGNRPRFVNVPWPLLYWALRTVELTPLRLPFRADSLLGLVRPAPDPVGVHVLDLLGVDVRPLSSVEVQ